MSLICGIISGAGIFLHMPHWPSLMIPRLVAILGIISVLITIKDKKINSMLKLGGMMINILPLLGSFITKY
ncbi:hypothetical protein [Staphylococcus saccharolyticus]|nr:hypothetical protein [Staphylococcus saccharolyticus]MBL7566014.1 hypothetical protein [Staphylococcus saccharolyticus]MBL7572453.1 hypothetical protein [Staphylococcus saccharolyticus]QQB99297.1 hypothetical protein I6I31_00750 [Staphylococcus saccharolyticus]QRJ67490.1 hypothetical protein DMB76_003595 [Staphylococcus saccharolyticus]RTX98317.1 hypothetical protein CD145_03070 [Staphylococcus saccharolyticus]